jgi:uncharacterized membrane protein YbhN (UPF0104 family)
VNKYIRIAISAVLLSWIAWRTNWSDVASKFANLRIEFWLVGVGFLIIAQIASARRWQLFAREMQFNHTLPQYTAFYFIGTYFNLLLPTSVGGDVMRVVYLDGKSRRKLAAFASVVLERLNGLMVLIAMACVGVLITPVALPSWVQISVACIAGCAVLGIVSLPIVQRWDRLPLQRRQQLQTMLGLMRIPQLISRATLLSFVVQLLGVLTVWCVSLSLGLDIPVTYCCILGPMVSLLTLLPISVNGMGVREGGTILFLTPIGIEEGAGTTLAFLWFAVQVSVSLIGGLIYLFGAYPKAEEDSQPDLKNEGTNDDGSIDRGADQGREGELKTAA